MGYQRKKIFLVRMWGVAIMLKQQQCMIWRKCGSLKWPKTVFKSWVKYLNRSKNNPTRSPLIWFMSRLEYWRLIGELVLQKSMYVPMSWHHRVVYGSTLCKAIQIVTWAIPRWRVFKRIFQTFFNWFELVWYLDRSMMCTMVHAFRGHLSWGLRNP